MLQGTVLGFDYGSKRIGIAIADSVTLQARPLITVQQGNWQQMDKVCKEWQPKLLVVGISYYADNKPTPLTTAIEAFVQMLKTRYQLPVVTHDERLSSIEAENLLKQKKQTHVGDVDKYAATVILQAWLDEHNMVEF